MTALRHGRHGGGRAYAGDGSGGAGLSHVCSTGGPRGSSVGQVGESPDGRSATLGRVWGMNCRVGGVLRGGRGHPVTRMGMAIGRLTPGNGEWKHSVGAVYRDASVWALALAS